MVSESGPILSRGENSLNLQVGEIICFERTFTKEDVEVFTKVSGDKGDHHANPDELGRVMVQGMLTATCRQRWAEI